MKNVVRLQREACRAIVVREAKSGPYLYEVAPLQRGADNKPPTCIGQVFGENDRTAALQVAIILREKSGLPVIDLTAPRWAGEAA